VDAECDKLATVVGRQFITLSVHLCVQHDGREAARRAGQSASAETEDTLLGWDTRIVISVSPCLSVCLFVCLSDVFRISKTSPNSAKFSVHVTRGSGSVFFWRQCDTLCISGFVNDVMFSYYTENRPESKMTRMFRPISRWRHRERSLPSPTASCWYWNHSRLWVFARNP